MDSAGGSSSGPSQPNLPSIGYLRRPLTLQELKELTWGGPSEPDEFKGIPDDEYGQMFVYDTTPGSDEGIIAALHREGLFSGNKYETLLNNLTAEQSKLEMQSRRDGKLLEDLHWEVIVEKASWSVVMTFVFAQDV